VSGPIVAINPLFWLSPVSQETSIRKRIPIDRNRRNLFESVVTGTVYPPVLANEEERGTNQIGIIAIPPSSFC
jgi:hypothetical protein